MTRQRISPRYRQGFSLIELMISLAIGLLITVATFSAFTGASGATRMAEEQGRMHEDAQAALTILSQQLRMAGYNHDQPPPEFSIRGCDGQFGNITTASNLDALTCIPDTTKPDSIAVSYEADGFNTVPTAGGLPTDCLGNALSIPNADNRFYVDTASSIPSLYCKGSGGEPQALVENIEDMQFNYGAAETPDGAVAGYLRADEVIALSVNHVENWKKVRTVHICVLVRSVSEVVPDAASAQYNKCDRNLETVPPDRRLRRAYTTTVVLRNRLPPPVP
ncbi:MAG: PilW family protein [Burkholderiaceae bacterium]